MNNSQEALLRPFGEFVHLYFKNIQKYAQILKGGTLWLQ